MMRLYKIKHGVAVEQNGNYYTLPVADWDHFINDDNIYHTLTEFLESGKATITSAIDQTMIQAPIGSQELWACGVTYLRSKVGRQEESASAGGSDFYAKVYEAERPEVFFKSTPHRVTGHLAPVRIRKDSNWNVPEPELTLIVTSNERIIGYTIGNDMSSRSIEGENPLYLPQAKTYDGCASLGPCILITDTLLADTTNIGLVVLRNKHRVFEGSVPLAQMKRSLQELVSFVYRECSFPQGCMIMTGTGIVPGKEFTLHSGDEIQITIDNIGTLINTVA